MCVGGWDDQAVHHGNAIQGWGPRHGSGRKSRERVPVCCFVLQILVPVETIWAWLLWPWVAWQACERGGFSSNEAISKQCTEFAIAPSGQGTCGPGFRIAAIHRPSEKHLEPLEQSISANIAAEAEAAWCTSWFVSLRLHFEWCAAQPGAVSDAQCQGRRSPRDTG